MGTMATRMMEARRRVTVSGEVQQRLWYHFAPSGGTTARAPAIRRQSRARGIAAGVEPVPQNLSRIIWPDEVMLKSSRFPD